jgi:flagellar biosynthesis/type III secretory pathway chaperone
MAIVATGSQAAEGHLALGRILELLREEHAALESGDAAALSALASAKERALHDLRQVVGVVPGRNPGSAVRDPALLAAIRDARDANLSNGIHASTQLAYTQTRLAGLMQAAGRSPVGGMEPTGLYHADGFTGGRKFGSAAFGYA